MTSLFPPGAGGQGPKGPVREPRHPDERDGSRYAPRPPSERDGGPEPRRGVGVFRYAGCGLGFTIALALVVGIVVVVGYLRDDPGRNPAPDGYRAAACEAFDLLSGATASLADGAGARTPPERIAAARSIDEDVAAANDALTGLPTWEPGRSLDQLLGSQIITLTNAASALRSGESVTEDLAIARDVDEIGRDQLASGRYGFDCSS
ncbi:MAG: hypothetical protein K5924_09890 [Chloroflexi bacterium]|nr:hypothetical protein [Chloroflexota bacterium]